MEINAQTKLCGVIGNPVEHSLSPAIHNAAFQKLGLNFVYLAFRVENIADAIRGIRALGNVRGFSVTIPHKVSVIRYLDEVEPTARHIGAINTIVVDDGKLIGYNTDASGALRALRDGSVELKGRRVAMLGSGGAARAIAFALAADSGVAELFILAIDEAERRGLVSDLQAKTSLRVHEATLSEDTLRRLLPDAQVLIHCTPVGMHPRSEESCVPAELLHARLAVMDIVYNPPETRLLRDATAAGCQTVRGLEMFLNQAAAQFELWTNRPAPTDVMRAVLVSRFA
ncbi:MAG TPA: shikimate dehydrogenase [Nitrospiraceae bacterium]|jgi:shikimate dehydrogenase|nr:shikimate dehydrogenase [Nitrospiraceae bacterium]